MEIKPNIFIREYRDKKEWLKTEILALPEGYDDLKGDWDRMTAIGDRTIISGVIDIVEMVLLMYVDNLFLNGKFNTEEGKKARQQYEGYSGKEWVGGFYQKRST